MSVQTPARDRLVELRRELHRHPEPAWCEFYTTSRIVDEIERIGVDELYLGREALDADARTGIPDEETLDEWHSRAHEAGAREDLLERMAGGHTGAVAVLRMGDDADPDAGPHVGLRVDIDALPRVEADDADHYPAAEGFRAETPAMHACGHDAHAITGIGVLEAIENSDFAGTLTVFFQPAEEVIGGGRAMARSGHLDDVDYLLALHVGLDHPTGEVVAGVDGFLAVSHFHVEYEGEPAHAGGHPELGRNAVQAMATAIQNLYAIPRHSDGPTRINAGIVEGGSATNIVPETARIEGELRGDTVERRSFVAEHAERIARSAGEMHGCDTTFELGSGAPGGSSDQALVDVVQRIAADVPGVTSILERDDLGGSEDATFLMNHVQERGGLATYVGIGTDHPGGHHTATFDVDEDSLPVGVGVLAGAIEVIGRERPKRA